MPECTLVLISNKQEVYMGFLESLDTQKEVRYQLICIDNYAGEFAGTREAYNAYLAKAQSDWIIFLHPDIRFEDPYALRDILSEVNQLGEFGVAGVAGCLKGEKWGILSDMLHGKDRMYAGERLVRSMEVQTLNECLFVMSKKYVIDHPFSDIVGWHLACVEQCLEALVSGKRNYVIPSRLWHLSAGDSLDPDYLRILEILIDKYAGEFDYFNTTVKQWQVHGAAAKIYRKYYRMKQILKRRLRRYFK